MVFSKFWIFFGNLKFFTFSPFLPFFSGGRKVTHFVCITHKYHVNRSNKKKNKKKNGKLKLDSQKTTDFEHQNPTKSHVVFSAFSGGFPPSLTRLSSKCHNFFCIWSLLGLEKCVRPKVFTLSVSHKKKLSLSVSYHFTLFFQTIEPFLPKIMILMGNRQSKKKLF